MRLLRPLFILFIGLLVFEVSAQKVTINLASNLTEVNENCSLLNNEKIQFKLDSAAKASTVIKIKLVGTAQRGSDYATNLEDSIVFAKGDSVKLFDLTVFNDGIEEGQEEILIISTNAAGKNDTGRVKINDHILQILTSQDTFSKCSNEPFDVPIKLVSGAQLEWNPVDLVKPSPVPLQYTIFPNRTGKIYFTGRLLNCAERDSIYIISQPIGVTLNTRDTAFLCFPDSIQLIASVTPGNAQVSWTLDSATRVLSNNSIRVVPIQSKSYIVNVTSGVCKASDTVHVRIDSLRDTKITVFPKKDKYCKGDSIFFFSQRHPKDLFPFINPKWNPSNGFQTSADTLNAVIMADKTTTYFRITKNNACSHTDSVYIKVVEPSIPVGPVDTTVCPGETIQLNFKPDGSEYKEFKWTPQDGLISCEKCPDPKIKVNGEQMYKVEAKKDGCDATTDIKTHVFSKPPIRIATNVPTPITAGSDVTITLLGTNGMKSVMWRVDGTSVPAGALTFDIKAIKSGNHNVDADVTDINGCMWSYNFVIQVICPSNNLQLQRNPSGVVYEGTNVTITAVGVNSSVTNIKWTINGSNNNTNGFVLNDKPNNAGTYTYTFEATDVNGCPLSKSISIQVIPCIDPATLKNKIPNAFTPNGDMKNDYFTYSDGALKITKILVFSRWGQLVYNNSDPANGWDGKINGKDAASDIYIYRLTYICGDGAPQEVSGTVTLLR
ncbi:MAG: gliding motility-associated C-terminal domain-containing protein [Saprospiraceae bacterium]